MSLYSYKKALVKKSKKVFNFAQLLSGFSFVLGVLLLIYLTFSLTQQSDSKISLSLLSAKNTNPSVLAELEAKEAVLGVKDTVWDRFYLTIPKLGLDRARVTTNVESDKKEIYYPILSHSLGHYKGTSYPGQEGDVFIYGHSVLPVFYNPKDYMTIFTKLNELKVGDEIFTYWGGEKFVYKVVSFEVVSPENLDFLNFKKEGQKTLTLMTCNPPGTYLKRLLVKAQLVD